MAESDVKLVVGIDLAASRAEIKGGIANIQSFVEGKKLKIKVELDNKNGTSIGQQITSAIKNANASGLPPIQISDIKISPAAISSFRSQLETVISTLNLDKGVSMTFKGDNIQEITKSAEGAKANMDEVIRKAAEYNVQMQKFTAQRKEMQTAIKSVGAGETQEEIAGIEKLKAAYEDWLKTVELIKEKAKQTKTKAVDENELNKANEQREAVLKQADAVKQLQKAREEEAAAAKQAAAQKEASEERERANTEDQIRQAEQLAQAEQKRQSLLKQSADLMTRLKSAEDNWTKSKFGKTSNEYSQISGYIEQLQKLDAAFKGGSMTPGQYSMQLKQISAEFARTSSVIKSAGENTGSFFDRIGNITSKFASWLSVSRIIMEVYQGIKKMISASIELESAFARIQIVTGATDSQMSQFATTTANLAQDLGKSITDVAKTIETFSRLGYDLPDASELAKFASVLSNVADVGLEEATTGLTSIIKGFGMDVSNASHVADVLTEVGQKYAVSASEMMEAYEKSGAALNATGTSFEKSAGLIAAANAAVSLCRAA